MPSDQSRISQRPTTGVRMETPYLQSETTSDIAQPCCKHINQLGLINGTAQRTKNTCMSKDISMDFTAFKNGSALSIIYFAIILLNYSLVKRQLHMNIPFLPSCLRYLKSQCCLSNQVTL